MELKKGYYSHLFNKIKKFDFVEPIRTIEFYDRDYMKTDASEEILFVILLIAEVLNLHA